MADASDAQSHSQPDSQRVNIPSAVERLKKMELNEDQWISGEELSTAGSSDEDDESHDFTVKMKKRTKKKKDQLKSQRKPDLSGFQDASNVKDEDGSAKASAVPEKEVPEATANAEEIVEDWRPHRHSPA